MLGVPLMLQQTEECSGAEVVSICQEAALLAMKDDINAPFVSRPRMVVTMLVNERVERYLIARLLVQQKE